MTETSTKGSCCHITRRAEFWRGARDSLPLVIGAVPFGIIFGTLSTKAGLSAAGTMGMSIFVFAGSAQFIAMGLVGAGTAWPMIVLTTFVVNFRHLLYTATLLPYLKRLPPHWQAILAFGLTDETFAVAVGRWRQPDSQPNGHWYQLGSMLFMYSNWNLCTLIGLMAGKALGDAGGWGLDFAMVAAFIGMVLPYMKDKPNYAAVLVAGVSALIFFDLPHKLGLIIASLLGIAAGVLAETRLAQQRLSSETAKGGQ
ncbi:MAG: AzlC family ABC transporter permease [Desulfobacteraceae bacterium]|jgi:4-azaleucine resistance transporter AzlC